MCTLGVLPHHYLFKTRDLWQDSSQSEMVVERKARFRYIGIEGRAYSNESGLNSGINEAGIAVAITFVDHITLKSALGGKTPRGVLVEDILATCETIEEAVNTFIGYKDRPLVGGNIVITSPEGGVTIEQLYPRFALEWHREHPVVRTNHFLNLKGELDESNTSQNSLTRWQRLVELLHDGERGADSIKTFLGDHSGKEPICNHKGSLVTRSAVIYDLNSRTLQYHSGFPCANKWTTFNIS